MDKIKTLTPLQLWQGYNPVREPLDINVMARREAEGIEITEYAFTAINCSDGKVRIPVTVTKPKGVKNLPVLIIIADYFDRQTFDVASLVQEGMAVVTFDYSGKMPSKAKFAKYPKSLFYGNATMAAERLNTAEFGANETSLFVWVKVVRRLLTLLYNIQGLDTNRIGALSWGEGANILWQTAGIDGRLSLSVPLMNCGYAEYVGYNKYSNNSIPQYDEERTRWNTACSVQAYAKFVYGDVYCVAASNDFKYSMDRMWDTMALINPKAEHRELVNIGLQGQIYKSTSLSVYRYLVEKLVKKKAMAKPPVMTFGIEEGKLVCDIACDNSYDTIENVDVCYAYKETNSAYRNWKSQSLGVDMLGKAKASIRVFDSAALLFVTINVTYRNGYKVTAPMQVITPNQIGTIKESVQANRIIYEKKMGVKAFSSKTNDIYVHDDNVFLAEGAQEITGVTVKKGDLINYNIGDVKCEEESYLQLDLFSHTKNIVEIKLVDSEGKSYKTSVELEEKEEWTKVQLSPSEFKDAGRLPLKEWADIKILVIKNAEEILVNNIIWV